MDRLPILIVGTHKPIMETIARLIDRDGQWLATIAFSSNEALALASLSKFKMVLVGAGLTEDAERQIQQQIANIDSKIPVIKHYGGGSGLLFAEIKQALQSS